MLSVDGKDVKHYDVRHIYFHQAKKIIIQIEAIEIC